jgi:hypothetical protein
MNRPRWSSPKRLLMALAVLLWGTGPGSAAPAQGEKAKARGDGMQVKVTDVAGRTIPPSTSSGSGISR